MSASAARGLKQWVDAVASADGDPSAARDAIRSLRSELGDLEEMAEQVARTEESLLQLRKVFEEGPVGMAVLGTDGRFLNVNLALCRLLGYADDQLIDMRLEQITHPEDRAIDQSEACRLWDGKCASYSIHKRYIRKDGSIVSARLIASVLRDEAGEPLYGLAMIEPIAASPEADLRLRRAEERWQLLELAAEQGLWDWVPGTDEMYWSAQITRMLGYPDGQFPPSVASFNALIHPDDHAGAWHAFDEHVAGRTDLCQAEFRLRASDGSYRWIEARGKAKIDSAGTVVRMVGLHTDITARKNLLSLPRPRTASVTQSVDLPASGAHCKTCRSDLLVLSRWRLWEWPLLLIFHRPVRCRSCGLCAFKPLWAAVPGRIEA